MKESNFHLSVLSLFCCRYVGRQVHGFSQRIELLLITRQMEFELPTHVRYSLVPDPVDVLRDDFVQILFQFLNTVFPNPDQDWDDDRAEPVFDPA